MGLLSAVANSGPPCRCHCGALTGGLFAFEHKRSFAHSALTGFNSSSSFSWDFRGELKKRTSGAWETTAGQQGRGFQLHAKMFSAWASILQIVVDVRTYSSHLLKKN
jgi:hypothetical protein